MYFKRTNQYLLKYRILKKNSLKLKIILSLVLGLGVLFTSCSSDDDDSGENSSVELSKLPITISFAGLDFNDVDSFTADGYTFQVKQDSGVYPSDTEATSWDDGI